MLLRVSGKDHIFMKTKSSPLALVLCAALVVLALSHPAEAGNQIVSNMGDTGLASQLRQKLNACQSGSSPGGTITFSVAGKVTLDTAKGPLPVITTNVTISGGGKIEISGNDATRIFNVAAGATLTLKNITISHGNSDSGDGGAVASSGAVTADTTKFLFNATSSSWSGSAILCWGPLTIIDSEFAFNTGGGGAVKPRSSAATTNIGGSSFHDNQSSNIGGGGYGGAMQVFDGPSVTISSSTFNHNSAHTGGAIYVSNNSSLVVTDSTFDGNSATGAGGAICNQSNTYLSGVTLSGNQADGGGAIASNGVVAGNVFYFSLLTLSNVTITGNSAGTGGGIYNDSIGQANLTNVTFSGNSAAAGNGIYTYRGSDVSVTNTLIAHGTSGSNCTTGSGLISGSFNLSDDNTCGFGAGRDNVLDLYLGPLADNGGPTLTHLPQAGSRAIDHGTANAAPATDQRGILRPQFGGIDVGAVEVVPQLFDDTDLSIRYDGWAGFGAPNANGGFFRWSNFTNDTITYKFTGPSIKWITWKGRELGKALVTIDGANKGTFDLYRSSTLWNQQIPFGGLTNAAHTIVIKVTGTKNANAIDSYIPLDGFLVGSSTVPVQESALAVQYDKWIGKKQSLASGGSYRVISGLGTAEFNFDGSGVALITALGPTYGKVNIYIDDQLVSSNLDLYAPSQQWRHKIVYSGLANSPHILDIQPTHSKNASSSGYGVVLDALEAILAPVN